MPQLNRVKASVRRSQLITTYGVGAIIPAGDESFMVAGTDRWDVGAPDLHEPRLEAQLHIDGFVSPPAQEQGRSIAVVRFPQWCSCPTCRRLDRHGFFTTFAGNKCGACGIALVPSRFVMVCSKGHIDDFPYFNWVHAGTKRSDAGDHKLTITAGGVSASLRDVVITCSCGKSSTMHGAFGREALLGIAKCSGRRPWLGAECEDCPETPRVLQRGASNVHFPVVRSSLSIPPWSEGALKLLNRAWSILKHVPDDALSQTIEGMGLAAKGGYSVDDLVQSVIQRRSSSSDPASAVDAQALRYQEYEALVRGKEEVSRDQEFVCIPAESPDPAVEAWFQKVMLVKRLREVRALEYFTRLLPEASDDPPERRAPISGVRMNWLPAIEVRGEGLFLELNSELLSAWESRPAVQARAAILNLRYLARCRAADRPPQRTIKARLVAVHTLAHALIQQWSLESGYPAASLRERLYVTDTMAGFLVYTATSDSAGSLGGLVAQAERQRLLQSMTQLLDRISWCSSDPLCIEADAAGVDALNLAACHACVLLPEVSCEEANSLLDRGLLVGTPTEPELGLLR
jgi:hypothetical protein